MNRRHVCALLGAVIVMIVSGAPGGEPGTVGAPPTTQPAIKPKFTLGPETTFISGPLRPDGTVSYVNAWDRERAKDVTPDENGYLTFLQAVGPKTIPKELRAETLRRVGLTTLPDAGPYLVSLADYARESDLPVERFGPTTQGDATATPIGRLWAVSDRLRRSPWTAAQFPAAADWLKANEVPLARVREAGRKPKTYFPKLADDADGHMFDALLPSPASFLAAGRTLSCRAMLEIGEGRADAAWDDIMAMRRLSVMLSRDGTLVSCLVGELLEGMAFECTVAMVQTMPLARDAARKMLADMESQPPSRVPYGLLVRYERFFGLDYVRMMTVSDNPMTLIRQLLDGAEMLARATSAPAPPRPKTVIEQLRAAAEMLARATGAPAPARPKDEDMSLPIQPDWDVTMRVLNGWFDQGEAAALRPTFSGRLEATRVLETRRQQLAQAVWKDSLRAELVRIASAADLSPARKAELAGQRLGEGLVVVMQPYIWPDLLGAFARGDAENALQRVALALAACRDQKGQYPGKLSDLVGDVIARLPVDPFTDQMLKYERTADGYRLYSVGPNGKDNGGRRDPGHLLDQTNPDLADDIGIVVPGPAKQQ